MKEVFEAICNRKDAHDRKDYGKVKSEVKVYLKEGRVLKVTYTSKEHNKGETLGLEIFAYMISKGRRNFRTMEEFGDIVVEVSSQSFRF